MKTLTKLEFILSELLIRRNNENIDTYIKMALDLTVRAQQEKMKQDFEQSASNHK